MTDNFGAPDPGAGAYEPGVPSQSYYPSYDDAPEPIPANQDLQYGDINMHYVAITKEEPDTIWDAGWAWGQIGTALTSGADAIRQQGITLSSKWEGAAKEAFLMKVGMLTAVLDNWAEKANSNKSALCYNLYGEVVRKRNAMVTLWQEYKEKSDTLRSEENANDSIGELGTDIVEAFGGKDRLAENLEHYSRRSREEILTPMSTAYDTAFQSMSTGAVYQGPKDALVKEFTAPGVGPGPGAPGTPAVPGAPAPAAPTAPAGLNQPMPGAVPTAALIGMYGRPQSPDVGQLRDQIMAGFRQPPTNPLNEQAMRDVQQHMLDHLPAPEAPEGISTPAIAPPPVAPALLRPTSSAPANSAQTGRGAAPTAPNLSAGSARPAAPGMPAGLNGRGAAPAAPGMGSPGAGTRPPTAPGLGGRGSASPAAPPSRSGLGAGSPALGGRSGAPTAPGVGGRPGAPGVGGRPGAPGVGARPAAPGLGGRTAGGRPITPSTSPNVPKTLQGRPTAPGIGARPGVTGKPGATSRPGVGSSASPRLEYGTPKGAGSLGGRSTAVPTSRQANAEAARRALRTSLTGRPNDVAGHPQTSRGATPRRQPAAQPHKARLAERNSRSRADEKPDEQLSAELALVGGTELFEADGAGDGVIAARTPNERVTRSGPAIGAKRD
ncbi:hypothetical protein [Cumulibacter soli]|uniref:hypothetical protein n=1 Tax=Cumulibacter soli TaxID=2546344 RepID=UPI0010680FD9|nr:hypothetical protein [Cumulibacter soli]